MFTRIIFVWSGSDYFFSLNHFLFRLGVEVHFLECFRSLISFYHCYTVAGATGGSLVAAVSLAGPAARGMWRRLVNAPAWPSPGGDEAPARGRTASWRWRLPPVVSHRWQQSRRRRQPSRWRDSWWSRVVLPRIVLGVLLLIRLVLNVLALENINSLKVTFRVEN